MCRPCHHWHQARPASVLALVSPPGSRLTSRTRRVRRDSISTFMCQDDENRERGVFVIRVHRRFLIRGYRCSPLALALVMADTCPAATRCNQSEIPHGEADDRPYPPCRIERSGPVGGRGVL